MATDKDERKSSSIDDLSDLSSVLSSDAESDTEEPQQVEWLATSRAKRSTAGNRMKSMLANEEPAAEDSDLELLFAEDEDDAGFTDDQQDASDVQMDSSSDEEDKEDNADELEGEKDLERQAREKRAAERKRKAQDAIPAKFRKKVRIEQPAARPPRPKKKSERTSWLPSPADMPTRASERSTTRISKQQLHQKMVSDELRRRKQLERMEKKAKQLEALKKPPMTQAERLAEAAIVERRNAKSLNRWEEAEKQREEERLRKIAALHSRKLDGPVVTFWSGIQELQEGQGKHVGNLVSMEEKAPRKKRQSAAAALAAKEAEAEASTPTTPVEKPGPKTIEPPGPKTEQPDTPLLTQTQPVPPPSHNPLDSADGTTPSVSAPPLAAASSPVPVATQLPVPAPVPPSDSVTTPASAPTPAPVSSPAPVTAPASAPTPAPVSSPAPVTAPTSALTPAPVPTSISKPSPSPSPSPAPAPAPSQAPASTPSSAISPPPSLTPAPVPVVAPTPAPAPAPTSMAPPPIPQPPETRPSGSGVLAAPVLAPPSGLAPPMLGGQMPMLGFPSGAKPFLAAPNTSHTHTPSPLSMPPSTPAFAPPAPEPTAAQPTSSTPKPKPTGPPPLLTSTPSTPLQTPQTKSQPPSAKPIDTPQEAPPSASDPPREGKVTRSCIILQNFDDHAIKDKQVQTQILFGRKMNKLAKPGHPALCVITHQPAKYRDPKTGLPYHNSYAYREIQRVYRGDYKWSRLIGAWVGRGDYAARGVPEWFLDPSKAKPPTPPAEPVLAAPVDVDVDVDGAAVELKKEGGKEEEKPGDEPRLEPVEGAKAVEGVKGAEAVEPAAPQAASA